MAHKPSSSKPSPILFLCLLGLLGYFGISVIQTMTDGYNYQDRVETLERKVQRLTSRKSELKQQLQVVQSKGFIESEARNKLHLAKSNETVVIFPQNSEVLSASTHSEDQQSSEFYHSFGNINDWYELFFE